MERKRQPAWSSHHFFPASCCWWRTTKNWSFDKSNDNQHHVDSYRFFAAETFTFTKKRKINKCFVLIYCVQWEAEHSNLFSHRSGHAAIEGFNNLKVCFEIPSFTLNLNRYIDHLEEENLSAFHTVARRILHWDLKYSGKSVGIQCLTLS